MNIHSLGATLALAGICIAASAGARK